MSIMAFLAPRRPMPASPAPRRFLGRLAAGLRGLTHSAPSQSAPVAAPEPTNLYAADELPALADIEAAAEAYFEASERARSADRSKRKARKVLDLLPAGGTFGPWRVFRKPSKRVTPDLEKIAAIFEAHQLGPIPMRPVADSLAVERVAPTDPAQTGERSLLSA